MGTLCSKSNVQSKKQGSISPKYQYNKNINSSRTSGHTNQSQLTKSTCYNSNDLDCNQDDPSCQTEFSQFNQKNVNFEKIIFKGNLEFCNEITEQKLNQIQNNNHETISVNPNNIDVISYKGIEDQECQKLFPPLDDFCFDQSELKNNNMSISIEFIRLDSFNIENSNESVNQRNLRQVSYSNEDCAYKLKNNVTYSKNLSNFDQQIKQNSYMDSFKNPTDIENNLNTENDANVCISSEFHEMHQNKLTIQNKKIIKSSKINYKLKSNNILEDKEIEMMFD